jgi:hypothetical protein
VRDRPVVWLIVLGAQALVIATVLLLWIATGI